MAKEITTANFETEVLKSEKPVLIDFWATWCGPCKMIGPNIEKLAEENADATVIKIDVDKHPEIAAVYGVQTIPTLIAFKKGQIVNQKIGFIPYPEILAMITS